MENVSLISRLMGYAQEFATGLFGENGLVLTFFDWLTGDALEFLVMGIAVSCILLAVKIVRGIVWGA